MNPRHIYGEVTRAPSGVNGKENAPKLQKGSLVGSAWRWSGFDLIRAKPLRGQAGANLFLRSRGEAAPVPLEAVPVGNGAPYRPPILPSFHRCPTVAPPETPRSTSYRG
jgi:hypothetical protein